MMTDIKPWWQSKTLWGAAVTLAAAGLGLVGIDVSEADRGLLVDLLASLGAAIGGILAIFGRIAAKQRIR